MRRRSSSSRITEDRRSHSTEEGGVQPGHRGQARSECRGGPVPVGSQRTDEVTVHTVWEGVQSGHIDQMRSEYRGGRGPPETQSTTLPCSNRDALTELW